MRYSQHFYDGQRLCSAKQNQPQRLNYSTGVRAVRALRLVSNTAAVRLKIMAFENYNFSKTPMEPLKNLRGYNPNGIAPSSPGLRRRSYPGLASESFLTPTGLRLTPVDAPQPRWGCGLRRLFPRVDRASQPWALWRNPFGIQLGNFLKASRLKQSSKLNFTVFALLVLSLVNVHAQDAAKTSNGFALPQSGHQFSFPRDHGSHDDFKIEWWYLTGHLFGDDDRRFGFQATFFRSAGSPTNSAGTNNPAFGSDKIFLAHMALLDVKSGKFIHQQRLNRDGWDAFSATNGLDVRNGNWSLRMTDTNRETMSLRGTFGGDATLALELQPRKSLVVFGKNSVSRKAAEPTAASYYLTFPRLAANGALKINSETNRVRGEAWMDHEISSSQLGEGQAGWDWCCLQFKDGREIMAYRMRRTDGSQDEFSTLAWVATNGVVTHLPSAEFKIETVKTWKSPATGAVYPVSVKIRTRDPQSNQPVSFLLEPLAENQELTGGNLAYWEGSCRVRDEAGREIGSAFLELTGYAGSLENSLR